MKIFKHPEYSYVTVVEIPEIEINKIDFDLCEQPKQTLSQYYKECEVKPTIVCNAGFFALSTGDTCFTYKDDGTIISMNKDYVEGIGTISGKLCFGNINEQRFNDFVSAYPVLIKDSKNVPITSVAAEINYKARRTILGYNHSNIYIIAVESPGMTFSMIQKMLTRFNLTYAINLDGGGSTKILHNGKSITSNLYNRAVDNVIAIYLTPVTIYRVQLGAFRFKKGADSLCNEIKKLTDTIGAGYKNAYVRKVGDYYKVQVGAFSQKTGANKVVANLKQLGYNSFVTTR